MLRSLACALLLSACATSPPAGPARGAPSAPPPTAPSPTTQPAAPHAPRTLPHGAVFADLLARARAAIHTGEDAGTGECLLATGATGFRLAADLLSAFRPIPRAPSSLAAWTDPEAHPSARLGVLSAWGRSGASEAALWLAPFTTTPPPPRDVPVAALLVGHGGIALRYGDRAPAPADFGLSPRAVMPRLEAAGAADARLYLTAEATTPVETLYAVTDALPPSRTVALAVALPPGTQLPDAGTGGASARCPDGLSALEPDQQAGDLDANKARAALAPLSERARACMRAAAGTGRVLLALRVAPDGQVSDACVLENTASNDRLAACLVASARQLSLPAPDPAGYVDLHVPLSLTPVVVPHQRPTCP